MRYAWILFVVLVAGCGQVSDVNSPKQVDVMLKWLHQAQFAGNYVALEEGFYEDEGLDVRLHQFDFESIYRRVADGEFDFGITGADELVMARNEGIPIKAVAVIYKVNPVCLYTLSDSGIKTPYDLEGKAVGIERASDGSDINVGHLYYAMLDRIGINKSLVKDVTIGYDPSELIAGDVDVSTGYIINEPNQAIVQGYDVNTMLVAEYGVNMYADVIFTSDRMIEEDPGTVQAFVDATVKGWSFAIEHSESAINDTMLFVVDSPRAHQEYMLEKSVPLIHTGKSPIGWMDAREWERVIHILEDYGGLENRVPVESLYDNSFVEAAYEVN